VTTRHDVEFVSEGLTLRGWRYQPEGPGPHPAVVVTGGFNSVKEVFLTIDIPGVFAAAGFVVLVYDHANCGTSDGTPRRELDPVLQQRGYQDAITYLSTRPDVDPGRIGIWGTSYSGGHVLAVAAADRRVRCVVAQAPTVSGRANTIARNSPAALVELTARFAADRRGRMSGEAPVVVPAFAEDSESVRFNTQVLPQADMGNWRNELTLRSLEHYAHYEPAAFIDRIAPTPLLMIVPLGDVLTPAADALAAYERALQPKALLTVPGGHYAVYQEAFETVSTAARDWFCTHLMG
jgi:fermentation-respiration switch protein FrsA (DUF1100 family)